MPRLSLAMIVKNEERTLGHCLDSVRGLVDEMVVVDTGSEDCTAELALASGARLERFPWTDDFAAARNESLRHCSGDWVLVLDADEAVDAKDHPVIREALSTSREPALRLILRNYFLDANQTTLDEAAQRNDGRYAEGAAYPAFAQGRGLRLCRRLEGLAFRGRIHELLDPFFESAGLPIGTLDAVIHHFGKTFPEREAVKRRAYLAMAEREARAGPANHQFWFNLLQQAVVASAWDLVLEAAQRYQGLQARVPILVPLGAGMALQALGRHAEALLQFQAILAEQPRHPAALTRIAVSFAVLARSEEAREHLRKAIQAQPSFVAPHVNLAELEGQLGRPEAARAALEAGLAANPDDPILLHALVQQSTESGNIARAVTDAWTALRRCPAGGSGTWHRLVAWSLYHAGNPSEADAVVDLGLQAFPGNAELLSLRERFGKP